MVTSHGTLGPPEAGKGKKDPPLESSEATWLCQQLGFGLVAPRTVRGYMPVVQATKFMVLREGFPGKPLSGFLSY